MGNPGTAVAPAPLPANKSNPLLMAGGCFTLAFAVFQISAVAWPPNVLRYFGGPVQMQATQFGLYVAVCVLVGLLIAVAGVYALAGAGKVRRLPLLRTALVVITAVYLLRGLQIINDIAIIQKNPGKGLTRFAVCSGIALVAGLVHLGGTVRFFRDARSPRAE